jgi:transcriptional regulator with XRE-family HTH domain
MLEQDQTRLAELGRFLRSRRELLAPDALGLSSMKRRRTPGLRREELADAAGISATWYVRLEQGRDIRASLHALDRLGKALRLDASEQAYLLGLARPDLDWQSRVRSHEMPSPTLMAMVAGLMPHPTYVLNKYWQVKGCNLAARVLLGDVDNEAKWGANLAVRLFEDPAMRNRYVDWPVIARSVVGRLRLSTATLGSDPIMEALVAQLCRNLEFKGMWEAAEISEAPLCRKTLAHPLIGQVSFDFAAFSPPGPDRSFTLSIHTAVDERTRASLHRLLATTRSDAEGAIPVSSNDR